MMERWRGEFEEMEERKVGMVFGKNNFLLLRFSSFVEQHLINSLFLTPIPMVYHKI
jgi:hypothetical protein